MSKSVADYVALLDGNHMLKTEGVRSKFFRFTLNDDFVADSLNVRPVITYRVRVPGKDTRLHVYINPEPTQNTSSGLPSDPDSVYTLSDGYFGQLISVLPGSKFKKGQENTIVFTISGDGHKFGDIEIGDVVLFHQRVIAG
jgi:hypothetical protein